MDSDRIICMDAGKVAEFGTPQVGAFFCVFFLVFLQKNRIKTIKQNKNKNQTAGAPGQGGRRLQQAGGEFGQEERRLPAVPGRRGRRGPRAGRCRAGEP